MKLHLFHWTIPLLIVSCSPNAIAGPPPTDLTTTDTTTTDTTQTGVIQFNNTGLSALAYPNCGGTCLFAIGRLLAAMGPLPKPSQASSGNCDRQRILAPRPNDFSSTLKAKISPKKAPSSSPRNSPTPSNSANPNASPSSPFSLPNDSGILTTTNCFNNSIGNKTVRLAFPMRLIS